MTETNANFFMVFTDSPWHLYCNSLKTLALVTAPGLFLHLPNSSSVAFTFFLPISAVKILILIFSVSPCLRGGCYRPDFQLPIAGPFARKPGLSAWRQSWSTERTPATTACLPARRSPALPG